MALNNFFTINFPYGLKRGNNNDWFAFNREYMPLGWNDIGHKANTFHAGVYGDFPIYTRYKNLTEDILQQLAWSKEGIERDANGEIEQVFLYTSARRPTEANEYMSAYFERVKLLATLNVSYPSY
jgi:hypothetical protein